jgi:hypothetical protein
MRSENFQIVAYDHYNDFQLLSFVFSHKFVSVFYTLFNDETDPRLEYKFSRHT